MGPSTVPCGTPEVTYLHFADRDVKHGNMQDTIAALFI